MDTSPFLDHYQTQLTDQLLRLCTNAHALTGQLLSTPDLAERWNDVAAPYLADAVPEIAKYPHVALGWMMYVGMGLAHLWDSEWERIATHTDLYALLRDPRGFDCLDEEVREGVLGFERDGTAYRECEDLVRACAQCALDRIRREQIEPQSPEAFHIYVRSLRALYEVGIAVELKRLGYKYEAID